MKKHNYLIVILAVALVMSCEKTSVLTEPQEQVNPFTFQITNDNGLKLAINSYLLKNTFITSTINEFDFEKIMLLGDMTTKTGVILIPDKVDELRYLFFSIDEIEITKGLIMEVEKIKGQTITAIIKSPTGKEIVEATFDSNANSLKPEKVMKSMSEQDWLCWLVYTMFGTTVGVSYGHLVYEAIVAETLKNGMAVISSSTLTYIGLVVTLAFEIYSAWACSSPAGVPYDPVIFPKPETFYAPYQYGRSISNPLLK